MKKEYQPVPLVSNQLEMMKICESGHDVGVDYHIHIRKSIPDVKDFKGIAAEKWTQFRDQLEKDYDWEPKHRIEWIKIDHADREVIQYFNHLTGGITIERNSLNKKVKLLFDHNSAPDLVEKLKRELEMIIGKESECQIGFVQSANGSLFLKFSSFKPYKEDITPFLGSDYVTFKSKIVNELKKQGSSGLYLLHGEPGTGKTSFLKTILSEVDKKAIFITPALTDKLTSPNLIGLLMDHTNSVIVIEDAETVLMKRQGDNSNAVSNLLNLTDGFPADFLELNIICTFNTDIDNIDPALLRKGRLNAMKEFKKVTPENIRRMTEELNLDLNQEINEAMTVADVWNGGKQEFDLKTNGIGFNKN
ncbi:MAG: AAA family ATPase [Balneolaceae bacterium]